MSDFADVRQIEQRDSLDARTRRIVGDGSPFLMVEGLQSVESVRVGTTDIPLVEVRRYPEDASGRLGAPVERRLVDLQTAPDGRQVLLRSSLSNDGVWQKDAPVYVTGDWGGAKESDGNAGGSGKEKK
jgi:hypothetical protein